MEKNKLNKFKEIYKNSLLFFYLFFIFLYFFFLNLFLSFFFPSHFPGTKHSLNIVLLNLQQHITHIEYILILTSLLYDKNKIIIWINTYGKYLYLELCSLIP